MLIKIRSAHSVLALAALLAGSAAHSTTYYVDGSASNDSGSGSQSSPKKYIGSGISLLSSSGGDTLIIQAGTYSNANDGVTSVPSGKVGAYNIIKAAIDGTVTIKGALTLGLGDHYVQFEGLKWDFNDTKVIEGRYVKFIRTAFKGGATSGNNVTVQIGTNDASPGAQYVLLEDSWVYGPGGRYKVLVYNSDSVILRRVVARHDGGWSYDGQNPQGVFTVYDSKNIRVENCLAIDSLSNLDGFESNFYIVGNGSTNVSESNVKVSGSMVLNGPGNGMAFDGGNPYQSAVLEDVVIWNAAAGGIASNGSAHSVAINRATVNSGGTGFADWNGGGRISVSNSIAYKNSGGAVSGLNSSNMVSYGNGSDTGTVLDPTKNGLVYLPRIEVGSKLKTLGSNGGQIGAQMDQRIGASGTMFGEPGYDTVGMDSLWPWPNEGRIKSDFSEYNSRGFSASSKTLTDYVWSYLGSASPTSTSTVTPNPPTNLSAH